MPIDFRDAEHLLHDLEVFARRAVPYAVRNGLNASAFQGRKIWQRQIETSFVTRNKWVKNSVRVEKASGTEPERMEAVLGSLYGPMELQEFGGIAHGRAGRSKPIPTAVAAGQAAGTRPRTKAVRRPNWLSRIQLRKARGARNRKQQNAITIAQAAKAAGRNRVVSLHLDAGRRGLFRVTGRKRLTIRMLYDLSRKSVRVPAEPTLQRTLDELAPWMPTNHRNAIIEQLKRHRVLGY